MAVAAADFYTYAKATGTPLPNSKKEEAQLAPAVDKWKKSRLINKFTESKEDYIERNDVGLGEAAGLTAALAGIGAGVVAARNPATRQRISQILRPNVPVNEPEAVAKVVEQVTPQAGTGVSTNVGGITQDLNVDLSSTPATPIAKTWVEQKARQTPQRAVVVEKVAPQPEVATVVPKVTEQPQVTSQQALDDYRQKWINENSTSKQNVSSLQEGIRQEKLARGDREISRGYFESDARRQEQDIARRGFNETDLPPPQDQPAPGASLADDPASYSPRTYIESTGAIAPKTQNIVSSPNQFSREQLIELNQYASSVADYDGNPDFIRINDKLDNYLEGKTDVYPLNQQDIQKFDNSLTDLKKVDPGAFDNELDQLASDVNLSLGGKAKEQTFLAQEIQVQPAQPVTLTDAAKADDLVVSQQSIENSNLNLNANANTGVQIGLDPEVSKVASSPIKIVGTATPVPVVPSQQTYTTKTRTEGFYTRPQNLSPEARQAALSQVSTALPVDSTGAQYPAGGTFLREYTTLGSKIAGDTNVQRGTVPPGQLELPIVYSTRGRTNPTLRTQLVNESPTYTSVDEYLARYEPVPTADVQLGPSSAFLTDEQLDLETKRLRAISDLGQREEELIKSGLRPVTKGGQPTTRFDNARALGWTSKQYTPISITNRQFQETASMPKSLREVLGEPPGRVFYETTSEGQIIPETVEVRGERPQILMEPKGGGGRKRAESVAPPDNPLDTLIVQKQVMPTGAQTRPVQDAIERDVLTETGGLELSPPIYANTDQTGRVIDAYGIQTGNYPKADLGMRPTEMPISPRTGKETQSFGTRPSVSPEIAAESVRQSEILRRLSDPTWLTNAGVDLNRTTPQEQVQRYLKSQGIEQNPLPQIKVVNENVDLAGQKYSPPLSQLKTEPEKQITTKSANLAPSPNYPAAQNQVTYVPANPKSVNWEGLKKTASEIEDAKQMHLLNYISAAHGQIQGGARVGGTKMRNKLTPYSEPSDAMLRQLITKRREERI